MSSLSTSVSKFILIASTASVSTINAQPISNDLFQAEQWGLQAKNTSTCAERPEVDSSNTTVTYTCDSYTDSSVSDIDINAPEGWSAYTPALNLSQQEVVIALIDTGIDYTHPDLAAKIWMNPGEATGVDINNNGVDDGCEDNIDGDNNGYLNDCHGANTLVDRIHSNGALNPAAGDPIDDTVGHGTNMAGVMIAQANNLSSQYHGGIVGVAGWEPNIKIATCKAGQMENDVFPYIPNVAIPAAKEKAITECTRYFYNLKQAGINVVVINSSGGMSQHINVYNLMYPLVATPYLLDTPEMYMLVDLLEAAGIMVVASAGNNSWSIDQVTHERAYFPASFTNKNVISVAGINNQGELWSGSSYGRWSVDLAAPGQDILSTVPTAPYFDAANSDFIVTHGTSQSAAYVSGAVALIRANASTSNLDAAAVRRLLLSSGKPLPALADKTVSGSMLRLADNNGTGALTCNDQIFRRRQSPAADSMIALPGEVIKLEVESYNCADVSTESQINVTVSPGNTLVSLYDNGQGDDETAADGVYSGSWTVPYGEFEYLLSGNFDTVKGSIDELSIQASLIEDNTDNTDWIGKWWPSIYRSGFYGNNYRYATKKDPEKIFTWSPTVQQAGYFRVYARWPDSNNFATNALFRIHSQSDVDGSTLITESEQDQTSAGDQWNSLGLYWFSAGTKTIQLSNQNADGTVVADAVQLVPEQIP